MATPHIDANMGDFAKTVLMPGDPLRSEFIAKNMLEGAVLINNVRGIQGYTGKYKGKKVSVMASGMGVCERHRRFDRIGCSIAVCRTISDFICNCV